MVRWLPNAFRYELQHGSPLSKGYPGIADVYDLTLKEGDTLCYWAADKKGLLPEFQELDKRTTEILERRYETLEKIASSKKYKPGWIYYRMREPIAEVNSIWAAHGYYFCLQEKAGSFASRYQWKYFRREAELDLQQRLEMF